MLKHIVIIVAIGIILPLAFPYSLYGIKNPRRVSRANTNINNPSFSTGLRQRYDQSGYRSSLPSPYYSNYDTLYDSGSDSYYIDDDGDVDPRSEREYMYGKPTYHGEYKPTRYYYARAPNYNYYNDQLESTNPLDDLHEEMLQEEQHERQRNYPVEKTNWFQNTGQPKTLTSNFMKNLMLYNNGINVKQQNQQPHQQFEVANAAYNDDVDDDDDDNVDEDIENPYFGDLSNQNEPYDYFDPLKFQSQQFNQFDSPASHKPIYFNQNNLKETNYFTSNNKNFKQNDYDDQELHEDKDEKDLESLRKPVINSWKNTNQNEATKHTVTNDAKNKLDMTRKHDDTYNGGYDTGFDYDEDTWINWDRKRSLPQKQNENVRPLKVLEYQLTKALLDQQADVPSKILSTTSTTTTTVPPPTISTASSYNNKAYEQKGQKEVVLTRPATPLRRHFSDTVLKALTKTTNEMMQSNQDDNVEYNAIKENGKHMDETKKHKRFVSNESSLVQQLNGLKRKIKA